MCGIAGFVDRTLPEAERAPTVTAMAARLRHRGPDDAGAWCDPTGVALGHQRLAIVDLSPQGHQPMASACGRYTVVFNGEIYNFRALRADLERDGAVSGWRGGSDTEVLLAEIAHRGLPAALARLVGMFAFALWDRRERTLTLVRDRMGEKPLYFGRLGPAFVFASELKALAAHPRWRGEVDRDAVALLMRYGYIPCPHSIFAGIEKLAPGALVTVRCTGTEPVVEHATYWAARTAMDAGLRAPFAGSAEDAIDELERLLRDAVAQQMVADVPLGAFLSGGIDSSTIVALMQAQSSSQVQTFTIGFQEQAYNEAEHAVAVARHLGTRHTTLVVTPRETLDVIPQLPVLFDEPFADASQIPSLLVAQLARSEVTVALSGDGGDELFYGYRRFTDTRRFARLVGWIPQAARRPVAVALRFGARALAGARPSDARAVRARDKLYKAASLLGATDERELYWDVLGHWPRDEAVVPLACGGRPRFICTAADPIDFDAWMMLQDMVAFLPDDVLVKVDRTAMGMSLETRAPLLDHRVVEFAWRIPLAWKIRDGRGKWLLRQVLYRHVPRMLVDRPKRGFEVPVAAWLRGPLRDWAEALLDEQRLREQGFLDSALVRHKWQEHATGRRNWQYCLWDVLMFQSWLAAQEGRPVP